MTILISIFIFIIIVNFLCWFLMRWTTNEINKDNIMGVKEGSPNKSFFKYDIWDTVLYTVRGYVRQGYIKERCFVMKDYIVTYNLSSETLKTQTVTYKIGQDLVNEKDIIREIKEET